MRFDRKVCESAHSVMFWGPDRTAVAVTAYALAVASRRAVTWLDITSPSGPEDALVPLLARFVPAKHRFMTTTPDQLVPEVTVSNLAMWSLIRVDEPTESVMSLIDYLRLPQSVQALVADQPSSRDGAALLVTNSDRLSALYPEDLESTRQYVQAITRQSIKLVATLPEIVRGDRFAYDYVFHVTPGPEPGWQGSSLRIEKGEIPEDSAGGTSTPFRSIDDLGPILAGAADVRDVRG